MTVNFKRQAAEAALVELRQGMRLGLGTGSTAREFVDLLGVRVAAGFECLCVPTSEATAAQAGALGIPLATLEEVDTLDLTVDGADEIGPDLALIKGAGGALLREKIVAAASLRMVVIADASKLVAQLGACPLPVEVNAFGLAATTRRVAEVLGNYGMPDGHLELRRETGQNPFHTDGGHLILDACFGRISGPQALSNALLDVPGVVQHGLFLGMCDKAYVAGPDGVRTIVR